MATDPQGAREELPLQKGVEDSGSASRHIVVLHEPGLASYRGGRPGLAAPERRPGTARLDSHGAAARAYVAYLIEQQRVVETSMARRLGHVPAVSRRMQHAVNALVVDLSPAEAETIRAMPEVRLVVPEQMLELHTDVGPTLIGAPPIWDGSNPGSTGPARGEGTVIGVLDTGINFGSPSFAAVGPVDAYAHANPLGNGNYLGTCVAGGSDEGRCNAKLIGGHDFVCGAPVNACTTAGLREEPGFGDTNGHGTHVASIAAGNTRDAVYAGNTRRISGVATHANIVAYDVCYTILSTGQGSCPSTATVAAVDQAVADNIVDVINYSISGGTSPWQDATSLAFLGAVDAGIYVAASAGNAGPGANTLSHNEPWVASTAAVQHGRGDFQYTLTVTGPQPVPAGLAAVAMVPGIDGVAFSATIPGTTPLYVSAGINTTGDGCAAYPANTFAGGIALIRRGTCNSSIKVNNASAAGAVAVIIANNAAGVIQPSVPSTTVPVFGVTQQAGNALRDFGQANPSTTTAQIPFPPSVLANTPDQLGAFSSRGPAVGFDLVKPDVSAPGVRILAAYSGTTLTGSESLVQLLDGTSMASPHQAGAALLLKQLRPDWTVPELKSALQMKATRDVTRETGAAADPFDMGSGRIRVNLAANAGLVLDESRANFEAANPALGGDPGALNLASMAKRYCISQCQFVRRFRNPGTKATTGDATIVGLAGTVSPASFFLAPGATIDLTITVDSSGLVPDGSYHHGWLDIELDGVDVDPDADVDDRLTLPISVSVPPPVARVTPAAQSFTMVDGIVNTVDVTIQNDGGYPLAFNQVHAGTGLTSIRETLSTGVSGGFRSTIYTDPATAGSQAQLSADDFVVSVPTQITSIVIDGFVVSGNVLTSAAVNLSWSIYPDVAGLPAGNPQTNAAAATWTYTSTPTGAGVTTEGSSVIGLDLAAAGQNVTLPPGRYWVVVNTRGTFANRFAWLGSNTAAGNAGFASINVATNGTGNWVANPSLPGLSMRIRGAVPCDAPWIETATPASGQLARNVQQAVVVDLGQPGVGNHVGAICFGTNDPVVPTVASVVNLTVVPPRLVFTTEPPATVAAGAPFAVQPVITVQDDLGATATEYALPVSIDLDSGTGPIVCDQNSLMPVAGVATFAGCHIDMAGVVTLRASSGTVANSTTNPQVTVRPAAPSRLVFAPAPSSTATAGVDFATQPVVRIEDAFGNLVDTATDAVSLSLSSGTGPLLCDANTVNAVGGIATFSGCNINTAGAVTLNASMATIATSTTQPPITITFADPAQLVFTTPPSSTAVTSTPWPVQPTVTVQDAFGNAITNFANPIALVMASGAGTLSCNVNPVMPVAGVAQFGGCQVDALGTITLDANTAGIPTSTTQPSVLITHGPPARLVFATDPSPTATAGTAFAVQPVVRVEDALGNPIDDVAIDVSLALASGAGALLCDANTVASVAGLATFSGCRIETAGAVTLNASTTDLPASTTQPPVTIGAASASQLVFVTPPSPTAMASVAFTTQPVVVVQDAFGNTVTDDLSPITLALASGTGPLLCDANPVVPVAGIASFTGCRIQAAGTVTLDASNGAIATASTHPQVVIGAGPAVQLVFAVDPSPTAMAGTPFANQPVLHLIDEFGNLANTTNTPVTLALASGAGPMTCNATTVTPIAGVATFSGCRIDIAGTVTLTASTTSIAAATTTPEVVVGAAAASRLVFSVLPPVSAVAGQAWVPQPVLRVEDAFGNLVTDSTLAVSLALASGAGPLMCDANPVMATAGIATFAGCHVDVAGTIALNASAAGIAQSTSQPQLVIGAGAPASLVFTSLPTPVSVPGATWPQQPAVSIQDAFGNVVTNALDPVTLSLATGAGPLVCTANPVTPVAGVAQFAGCHVDVPGVVTLNASIAGIANSTTHPQVVLLAPQAIPATGRWMLLMLAALMLLAAGWQSGRSA